MPHPRHSLTDLIHDPICLILMERDGVQPCAVYRLMKSVKPLVNQVEGEQQEAA